MAKPSPKKAQPSSNAKKKGRNKQKQPQAKPAMQRVLVMKASGKKVLEWREWGS